VQGLFRTFQKFQQESYTRDAKVLVPCLFHGCGHSVTARQTEEAFRTVRTILFAYRAWMLCNQKLFRIYFSDVRIFLWVFAEISLALCFAVDALVAALCASFCISSTKRVCLLRV